MIDEENYYEFWYEKIINFFVSEFDVQIVFFIK